MIVEQAVVLPKGEKVASVKRLFYIAFPLMMMMFSTTLLILTDRIILSRYSLDAMNISALVSNIYTAIQIAGIKITYIATVFVGQANGAKKYHKVAEPVWQMIWFSILLLFITIPVAVLTPQMVLPTQYKETGERFYQIIIANAPLQGTFSAISAFYIGRGKTFLVSLSMVVANILNFLLDLVLIHGYKTWIPKMGLDGAAYSTLIANIVQVSIIFIAFISHKNHKRFKTRNFGLDKNFRKAIKTLFSIFTVKGFSDFRNNFLSYLSESTFIKCLRLGIPSCIGITLDIGMWAFLFLLLAEIRPEYVSVHTIVYTIFLFFNFFIDGLQKGVTAIAANIIGSGKTVFLCKLIRSSLLLYSFVVVFLFFPMIVFADHIIGLFLEDKTDKAYLIAQCRYALKFVWIFYIIDGVFWVYTGILTAGRDTRFLMITYVLTIVLLFYYPIYLGVMKYNVQPSFMWIVIALYKVPVTFLYIVRYKSKRWTKYCLDN